MDNRHALRITWVLLVIIILLAAVRIFLDVTNRGVLDQSVKTHIEKVVTEKVNDLEKPKDGVNGTDGYTPVKNLDYFDGAKGDAGADGQNGKDGEDGANGENGVDGLTPEFRCNEAKNRWEVRYGQDYSWKVLSGTPIKCTVTISDILEALGEQDGNQ